MKAPGIFVILMSQDGFKSEFPGNESTQKVFYFIFLFSEILNQEKKFFWNRILFFFVFVLRHQILGKKVCKPKNEKEVALQSTDVT